MIINNVNAITYEPRDRSDIPADAEERCRYGGGYSVFWPDEFVPGRCLHRAGQDGMCEIHRGH